MNGPFASPRPRSSLLLFCLAACSSPGPSAAEMPLAPEGSALEPCSVTDFLVPAPARPASGAPQGQTSLVPRGPGTVRFNGRAVNAASWIASRPSALSYAYLVEEPGGEVSFALELQEEKGKQRTATVRLSHAWRADGSGNLCSEPKASLSIHENIDDEAVDAIPGTVSVTSFDPDGKRMGVRFEAETTAYKIFIDVDVVGAAR